MGRNARSSGGSPAWSQAAANASRHCANCCQTTVGGSPTPRESEAGSLGFLRVESGME